VGITAGSREVPGRNACDRRHTYHTIIISYLINVAIPTVKTSTAPKLINPRSRYTHLKDEITRIR